MTKRLVLVLLSSVSCLLFGDISEDYRAAAENGETERVQALLDAGADANAEAFGVPVLTLAARAGHTATVRAPLQAGANALAKDPDGLTALMWAQEAGQGETAMVLLLAGADAADLNEEQTVMAFGYAASFGLADAIRLLLKAGLDVNCSYRNGQGFRIWPTVLGNAALGPPGSGCSAENTFHLVPFVQDPCRFLRRPMAKCGSPAATVSRP